MTIPLNNFMGWVRHIPLSVDMGNYNPRTHTENLVELYHNILCHPDKTYTELSIGQHFYWKGLKMSVDNFCWKTNRNQNDHDGIKDQDVYSQAITMIYPATGWMEICFMPKVRAHLVSNQVELAWLTRYCLRNKITIDRLRALNRIQIYDGK